MVLTRVDATLVVIRSTVSNVVANNVCLLKCHAVETQKNVIHLKCHCVIRSKKEEGEEQTLKTKQTISPFTIVSAVQARIVYNTNGMIIFFVFERLLHSKTQLFFYFFYLVRHLCQK